MPFILEQFLYDLASKSNDIWYIGRSYKPLESVFIKIYKFDFLETTIRLHQLFKIVAKKMKQIHHKGTHG